MKPYHSLTVSEYNEIIKTGLFRQQDTDGYSFSLIGTDFIYRTIYKAWVEENWFSFNNVDFEYVLEYSPQEIQALLLFHLDLFG